MVVREITKLYVSTYTDMSARKDHILKIDKSFYTREGIRYFAVYSTAIGRDAQLTLDECFCTGCRIMLHR